MGFCVLLLLMSISVSLLSVGASDGIIVPGKYISTNQSMISASENFALGFFSLGNSTPRYYLGIWYNKVQKKSVVFWVANRESLTDSLGTVDGFLNFENVKLLDHSYLLRNMSAKDGESRYLNNCSCTAYSYVNASEETSGTCLNWHGDLVDLLKEFVAPDLYVRIHDRKLAGNDRNSNKFTCKTMDIIFAVAAVSVGLLSVLFGNFIWRKNYGKQDPSGKVNLDWTKSFRIIAGIAQGLLYIHKYSRLKVIHRDLKSSNIILDEAMNPKISDFRMA